MLEFNAETLTLSENGVECNFSLTELRVTNLLNLNFGEVVSRKKLDTLWNAVVGYRTVDVHIKRIRSKLTEHDIVSAHGKGYMLIEKGHEV